MPEILFVHGTGVRRVAYDKAIQLVRRQAQKFLHGAEVRSCLWGEPEGASLRLHGASIPSYDDQPPTALSAAAAEQIELVTWRMLGEDPLFELRLLAGVPAMPMLHDGPCHQRYQREQCQQRGDSKGADLIIIVIEDLDLKRHRVGQAADVA